MDRVLSAFEDVPDPRAGNTRHDLGELPVIAFASVLCGATSCGGMATFGRARESVLRGFPDLGTPDGTASETRDVALSRVPAPGVPRATIRAHRTIGNSLHFMKRGGLSGMPAFGRIVAPEFPVIVTGMGIAHPVVIPRPPDIALDARVLLPKWIDQPRKRPQQPFFHGHATGRQALGMRLAGLADGVQPLVPLTQQ